MGNKKSRFVYPANVDLDEQVIEGGKKVPRYGPLKIREEGPEYGNLRPDGMLFDRCNPLNHVKAVNVHVDRGVDVTPSALVRPWQTMRVDDPRNYLPGKGAHGD
jgi:hypothetical protein